MIQTPPIRLALTAAFSISALVFVFLPLEIYLQNPLEFVSTARDLLGSLLYASFGLLLLLGLPALIPLAAWRAGYAGFLAALFIALWASAVFLIPDLGELDGASFDPGRHHKLLAWYSILFICILTAALLVVRKWSQIVQTTVAILGAGLLIISSHHYYLSTTDLVSQWSPVDASEISRFSSHKNLLIVLMDSFQADVLPQILAEQAELEQALEGFVYFPDTLGVAPSTYLTMPAFHSARQYDNLISVGEFYDIGVREGSFMSQLARRGYQVDLINPITGECPELVNICARQENLLLQLDEVTRSEAIRLLDLGLFRAAPGLLKKWLFDGANGPLTRLGNDVALSGLELRIFQGNKVLDIMAENLTRDNGKPTARLIHLFNTHPPYMFDKDCRFSGVSRTMNRVLMTSQIKCGLTWFVQLLSAMKAQGVYENSMIILTADTGLGNVYGDEDLSSSFAVKNGLDPGEFGRLIGGANPVLAIKFPGKVGGFRISNSQAQLTDIPATVCSTLGDCENGLGMDLSEPSTENRRRSYDYYQWKHEYWGLKHVPGLVRYEVEGPLWLADSWSRSFSNNIPTQLAHLDFSETDPPELFGPGWSAIETNKRGISKRWVLSRHAELYLPLPTSKDVSLQLEIMSAPGLDEQKITVYIDDRELGSRMVEPQVQQVTFPVPGEWITKPLSKLDFEFAQSTEPGERENRRVSVSFFQLDVLSKEGPDLAPGAPCKSTSTTVCADTSTSAAGHP